MNNDKCNILIDDYDYELPDERIAKYPLQDRASCKLLRFDPINCSIEDHIFSDLPSHIDSNSLLVVNNSRVIKARLFMARKSGALIEIFCLSPLNPSSFELALASNSCSVWQCLVGNSRKWKEETLEKTFTMPNGDLVTLSASRNADKPFEITFRISNPDYTFGQILEVVGTLPIPPYLHRNPDAKDLETYQTVYAMCEGSVAAPTAGLHFTDTLFDHLTAKGVHKEEVTLHVGAGTFLPVKSKDISDHEMHSEVCSVSLSTLRQLIKFAGRTTAVGTTSVRTLESLYLLAYNHIDEIKTYASDGRLPHIDQWEAYHHNVKENTSPTEVLTELLRTMEKLGITSISFTTALLIVPGFKFHITNALITNFHQPKSTLLLMIAALVGEHWKKIYRHALQSGYRFLSYGDACLIYPIL